MKFFWLGGVLAAVYRLGLYSSQDDKFFLCLFGFILFLTFYLLAENGVIDDICEQEKINRIVENKEKENIRDEYINRRALEIIKEECELSNVRKYTCIGGSSENKHLYSQLERNIAERIIKLVQQS